MKKNIILSNGKTVVFDSASNDGYEDVLAFYEPKLNTMVHNFKVPFHDKNDLKQICRMKLWEALKTFNPSKNVNFSTYLYTILNRKLFQTTVKYKTKKHSVYIENDNYISMNHSYDKLSSGQYLQTGKDKCPLNKQVITATMCNKCQYHVRYEKRKIEKGNQEGLTKNFYLCKYYKEVMSKRGEANNQSLDKLNVNDTNLLSFVSCVRQKKFSDNEDFNIEFKNLENHLSAEHFKIIEMIISGYNKSEIINELQITNLKFTNILLKISRNKKVKELLKK